jgi:penicillin-binding protein 2
MSRSSATLVDELAQQPPTLGMFHRRLILLALTMAAVIALLGIQLVRLTVVSGAQHLDEAEQRLHRFTILPTYRGSIVDRKGRVLATDRVSYAIAVEYEVITGEWVVRKSREQAEREFGRTRWLGMSEGQRREAARSFETRWREHRRRLFDAIMTAGGFDEVELERRLDEIRARVQRIAAATWERQREAALEKYGGGDGEYIFEPEPILEQIQAHIVLENVSDDVAFAFRALSNELPEGMFEVRDFRYREYPMSEVSVTLDRSTLPRPVASEVPVEITVRGVADHLLGSMRSVQAQDVEWRPLRDPVTGDVDLGGYALIDDRAGERGLERVFEDQLRGVRGRIHRRIDTGEVVRTEPRPGEDLRTTIDIALQARIQAILSPEFGLTVVQPYHHNDKLPPGHRLNSAAVVLDIASGEVRAMVSMPTRAMGEEMTPAEQVRQNPWVNRAVEGVYPPGSIIKPLVLNAAVAERVHHLDTPIECTGHFFEARPDIARCWIFRSKWGYATHGLLTAEDAIGQSCNIYFYTLAQRTGMERLAHWFGRFGLGEIPDVGLAYEQEMTTPAGEVRELTIGEASGDLPDEEVVRELRESGGLRFATIILGIGQGPVTWTPLQAANAYAIIARYGERIGPTLVINDKRADRREAPERLPLNARAVDAALEGLRRAVHAAPPGGRSGTGHHFRLDDGSEQVIFNVEGIRVWGKTGTAQAPRLFLEDTNGDGTFDADDRHVDGLDHSWFVGLVGPDNRRRPMFIIAVLVEYGGSGGRVAGPIANQIIRALQAEEYLPSGSITSAGAVR